MKKLIFGALVGLVAACGGNGKTPRRSTRRLLAMMGSKSCNILTGAGCTPGTEKCTWIIDQFNPDPPDVGHIGCAPASASDVGNQMPCVYSQRRTVLAVQQGTVCLGGTPRDAGAPWGSGFCKTVCDVNNVAPLCATGSGLHHVLRLPRHAEDGSGRCVRSVLQPARRQHSS